jgi:hypothetical protein
VRTPQHFTPPEMTAQLAESPAEMSVTPDKDEAQDVSAQT